MGGLLLGALRRKFPATEGLVEHDPADFLHEFGDVVSALMYSALFVPQFIEVEDSILLDCFGPSDAKQGFLDAKKESKISLPELESNFNWVEVPYLFSNHDSTDDEVNLLAGKIVEAWRGRLKALYPNRTFVVSTIPPEETGSVIGVQFFQLR